MALHGSMSSWTNTGTHDGGVESGHVATIDTVATLDVAALGRDTVRGAATSIWAGRGSSR